MLRIIQSVYDDVRRHGEETYPFECCGVLVGKKNGDGVSEVVRAIRCGNTREDSPENRYNIDPKDLIRIQLDSREEGLDILGFYHSHPDHPARWSKTDFAEAHWLGYSYVISSVEEGKVTFTKSFLLSGKTEDDKRFEDEPIEVSRDQNNG